MMQKTWRLLFSLSEALPFRIGLNLNQRVRELNLYSWHKILKFPKISWLSDARGAHAPCPPIRDASKQKTWQQSKSSTWAYLIKVGLKNTLLELFQVILINFTASLAVRSCLAIIKVWRMLQATVKRNHIKPMLNLQKPIFTEGLLKI